jgi:FkbM family methyltransferase
MSVIEADDGFQKLLYAAEMLGKINGVIHVGASFGEEAEEYNALRCQRVLWIEANPTVYQQLQQNIMDYRNQKAVNATLSDKAGVRTTFIVTNNSYSSSMLELHEHKQEHPEVVEASRIEVVTDTLDDLLKEIPPEERQFNTLVLDVQGAELRVLKGAKDNLPLLDFVVSEVNFVELYKGGSLISDLDAYLKEHGFDRVKTYKAPGHGYGDALYARQGSDQRPAV